MITGESNLGRGSDETKLGNVSRVGDVGICRELAGSGGDSGLPGAVKVALPSGLPPALSKAMGNIALPSEPFDTFDIYVKGHKLSRCISVWNIGKGWIMATERGGASQFWLTSLAV
jgi:hypothetical protein